MTNKQRLDLIEKFIRENKYADLQTLASKFDISLSTVRRALNDLETANVVRRHHGGASLVDMEADSPGGYDFITQDDRQVDEKHAIADTVAAMIEPGMTVLMDGGTTTYAISRRLVSKRIVVITNSLPIAALFGDIGTSETIVTGGTVYSRLGILYGPTCEQSVASVHADIAILGAAGYTEEGVWNNNAFIISTQAQMRRSSDRAFFVLDSSKAGKRNLHLASPFTDKFAVCTNKRPEESIATAMKEANCELILPTS